MTVDLHGIIPALVTPFDADGEINERLFRDHVRFILNKNVHGVCLAGSTGEGFTFSPAELRQLTAATVEEVNGKVPVVAGIIANSTREVIERANAVKDLGVAALQVTPTYYVFNYGEEAMFQYFKQIWEETGIPLVIYNVIPWNLLGADLVVRMMEEIPGVIGIKQSQGNISRAAELVIRAPKGKSILAAIDDLLYPCFMMGAQGTLAASPTAAPGPCVALWNAVKAGDHDLARKIHDRLVIFWHLMGHENLPALVKYCLELQGCEVGIPRHPMPLASAEQKAKIRPALEALLQFDPQLAKAA
ncbi:dihydrodipicolinate synthase family protein (plasmid) [Shinella sp. H4-D48]|jgi:4-hydroxy-tetrahydrodipicolinate synthase|uniref:dihydrodipicolinate synthase family protein n=1 Tax=Shinella sp. H4-D48 TaxID=2925841 RepID=UPI001F52C4C8|nr:dihydrodipicolinate synthase family protein [Shinella sp. H4-D48]UNK40723.1 dihydrodipicolinate synthase family protein [Shinella sp. H4-D48]